MVEEGGKKHEVDVEDEDGIHHVMCTIPSMFLCGATGCMDESMQNTQVEFTCKVAHHIAKYM